MALTREEVLTEQRLADGWSAVTEPRGAVKGTRIEDRARANGAVQVIIQVDCVAQPGKITTVRLP